MKQDDINYKIDNNILKILLKDYTTNKNIIWGTNNYLGMGYSFNDEITVDKNSLIVPRAFKTKWDRKRRIKERAEVFTSLWLCNKQINMVDEAWFSYYDIFNKELNKSWKPINTEVCFLNNKKWTDYVSDIRLEITCGEAPYLVTRYDNVTGKYIELNRRIGMLDRKLRIVNENTSSKNNWLKYAYIAYKSIYGYDWHGDNILMSRKNLYYTFIDNYKYKFKEMPSLNTLTKIATIISHNIWQMDGIKSIIPIEIDDKSKYKYCEVMDWNNNEVLKFIGRKMKFNVIIGNPPFSELVGDVGNEMLGKQLFPKFMLSSLKLNTDYLSLITPSRWFTADGQDKSFVSLREYLKGNNHMMKIYNYPVGTEVFENVNIKGGVNYFLYCKSFNGDTSFHTIKNNIEDTQNRPLFEDDLNIILSNNVDYKILKKVRNDNFISFNAITYGRDAFGIGSKDDYINSISKENKFTGSIKLYCKNKKIRYINIKYITKNKELVDKYKIFISKSASDPSKDRKVISKAYIGEKESACTDSFIVIGFFNDIEEALNLQKYMKTKFLRYLVSILKISQNVYQNVYEFVPLLDFSNSGNINWNESIEEIDKQLYFKYHLTVDEMNYIEDKIDKHNY